MLHHISGISSLEERFSFAFFRVPEVTESTNDERPAERSSNVSHNLLPQPPGPTNTRSPRLTQTHDHSSTVYLL
jgi:hypothetical protein